MSKILMIDDKMDNLVTVSALLKNVLLDCVVLTAESGAEGIQTARNEQPDTILLDIKMPRMDGYEVCRRLKSDDITRHIPVIMLTAMHIDTDSKIKGLDIGADAFLPKPIDNSELIAQVKVMLRIKKAEDTLRKEKNSLDHLVSLRTKKLQESEGNLAKAQQMAHIGNWNWDIVTNTVSWSDELYRIVGLSPQDFEPTYKTYKKCIHPDDFKFFRKIIDKVLKEKKAHSLEYRIVRPNNESRLVEEQCEVIVDTNGNPINLFGTVQDITERRKAEEQIKTSLKEKETLLMELYHRTKNNMQVIRSMLMLQAARYSNEQVQELVKDTESRIQAMSLVHQKLYQSKDLSNINVNDYVEELAKLIIQSHKTTSQKVALVLDIENTTVPIDTAIPLGLVLNELMSNTLKHAFPGERKGEVTISISRKESGKIDLIFSDNGVGVSEEFNFRKQETLGLKMITGIAEQQMDGIVRFEKTEGLTCHIEFSDTLYEERI